MDKVGKYLIQGKLGQGGMGVVYKALDPLLERVVALKTISTHLDAEPDLRARFFREGRSAAHLSHKNIITIYDIGEDEGVAYLAMEYLDGEDLKVKISRRVDLSLSRKLGIMIEVCEGLAHAHSRQVIHRDIKPANIFVPTSGPVKILDFGLARMVAADITRNAAPLGTPNYMSPEQVRGERVDHRTDIFSLGTLSYEFLTLRRPFDEDSVPATMFKIVQADPEPLEAVNPSIDPGLGAIVLKALAKQKDERYQTVDELRADLLSFSSRIATSDLLEGEEETTLRSDQKAGSEVRSNQSPGQEQSGSGRYGEQRMLATARTATLPITPPSHQFRWTSKAPALPAQAGGEDKPRLPARVSTSAHRSAAFSIAASLFLMLSIAGIWWLRPFGTAGSGSGTLKSGMETATPADAASTSIPQDRKPAGEPGHRPAEAGVESSAALQNPDTRAGSSPLRPEEARAPSADESTTPDRSRPTSERTEMILRENRKARSLMEEGKLDEATARLTGVLKVAPSDAEAGRLLAQLNAYARKNAAQALDQMTKSKEKAEAAGAPQLAGRSYAAARSMEEEARKFHESGQFSRAAARLYETSGLYASAALEADSEREARARRERSAEEERQAALARSRAELAQKSYDQENLSASKADAQSAEPQKYQEAVRLATVAQSRFAQQDYAGAGQDFEAAALLMRQARRAALEAGARWAAPPPELITKVGPAATLEADRQAIMSVLGQYTAALQTRDITRLKGIWPGLGGKQEEAIRDEFRNAREIQVQLLDVDLKLSGDSAVASARRHYVLQTLDGRRLQTDSRTVMNLRKVAGSWLLDRIGFESLR